MKRASLKCLFFVLLVFVLCGCSTIVNTTRTSFLKWSDNPSVRNTETETAFSGVGTSENERQAQLLAYRDLRDNIQSYLGTELGQAYYRELSIDSAIKELGLSVQEIYKENRNGVYTVGLLALGDNSLLQEKMSAQRKGLDPTVKKIEDYVKQGNEYMMAGNASLGMEYYIKSLCLSYNVNGVLDKEYRFETIFEEVLSIINSFSITISNIDSDQVQCSIKVSRRETALYSSVPNCNVRAYFKAVDGMGEEYNDSLLCVTDEKGRYSFKASNFSMVQSGVVEFKLDLEEEIKELRKVNAYAADKIQDAVDERKVEFSYNKKYALGLIGICIVQYEEYGELSTDNTLARNIYTQYVLEGTDFVAFNISEEMSDQNIIKSVRKSNSEVDCLLIIRGGLLKLIKTEQVYCYTLEGSVVLYSLKDSSVVYNSDIINSNGYGKTKEDAKDNCLKNFAELAYSLAVGAYV